MLQVSVYSVMMTDQSYLLSTDTNECQAMCGNLISFPNIRETAANAPVTRNLLHHFLRSDKVRQGQTRVGRRLSYAEPWDSIKLLILRDELNRQESKHAKSLEHRRLKRIETVQDWCLWKLAICEILFPDKQKSFVFVSVDASVQPQLPALVHFSRLYPGSFNVWATIWKMISF